MLVTQSRLTLCDPMDCCPPGSSVHGILQPRVLDWVAIPLSRGSSQPRDWTQVSCIVGEFFTVWSMIQTLNSKAYVQGSQGNHSVSSAAWIHKCEMMVWVLQPICTAWNQALLMFKGKRNFLSLYICLCLPSFLSYTHTHTPKCPPFLFWGTISRWSYGRELKGNDLRCFFWDSPTWFWQLPLGPSPSQHRVPHDFLANLHPPFLFALDCPCRTSASTVLVTQMHSQSIRRPLD